MRKDFDWETFIQSFDERRDIIIPGNAQDTVIFCAKQFVQLAQESIQDHNYFAVALTGGNTPRPIYQEISKPEYAKQVDWSKVLLFWSDERSVPPDHPDSNFHMAMKAGFASLPILKEHIFRMEAEKDIEENAKKYEELFSQMVLSKKFDLMLLGMGEDGHTASLFPRTHGLHTKERYFIANYIPEKHMWRMTATYACIHASRVICIDVIGKDKAKTVAKVLTAPYDPDDLPIQRVGLSTHKAIWVLDSDAASKLLEGMGLNQKE